MLAAPALAAPGVSSSIDPQSLPPSLQQRTLNAPLGETDPFGNRTEAGCRWSRMQIPTSQGLRWMDEEDCNLNGGAR